MNATWLKSLIFWIILIIVMFAVFQCSQNSENKKQTEDFKNIPAASDKKSPPDIDKKDIDKSSKINKDGKTDNTDN